MCEIILALSAEKMSTYKAVVLETTCQMLSTKQPLHLKLLAAAFRTSGVLEMCLYKGEVKT